MTLREVHVPDLGNFAEVPVIEVLVKIGDVVEAESAPLPHLAIAALTIARASSRGMIRAGRNWEGPGKTNRRI